MKSETNIKSSYIKWIFLFSRLMFWMVCWGGSSSGRMKVVLCEWRMRSLVGWSGRSQRKQGCCSGGGKCVCFIEGTRCDQTGRRALSKIGCRYRNPAKRSMEYTPRFAISTHWMYSALGARQSVWYVTVGVLQGCLGCYRCDSLILMHPPHTYPCTRIPYHMHTENLCIGATTTENLRVYHTGSLTCTTLTTSQYRKITPR